MPRGVDMSITLSFPDLGGRVRRDLRDILLFMAAQMQMNRGMLFDREGAFNSHEKWAPLRFRQGQILKNRGNLAKSMGPRGVGAGFDLNAKPGAADGSIVRMRGDLVQIGTSLTPARLMNDGTVKLPGGKLVAKNAKALRIPIPDGRQFDFLSKDIDRGGSFGGLKKSNRDMRKKMLGWEDLRQQATPTVGAQRKDARARIAELRAEKSALTGTRARRRKDLQIARHGRKLKSLENFKASDRFIFRKWVKIPARPFDNWTQQDAADFGDALGRKLAAVLKGY